MKTLDPIRIGIVGGGVMGHRHAQIVAQNAGAKVVAVADPFSDTLATAVGASYDTTLAAFLERDLDAVIIASPNDTHVQAALACLDAGMPTLVEKPVATTLEECKQLKAATNKTTVPLLVGHHRRHHPAVQAARQAIARGDLGDIVAVNAMWITRKSDSYFDASWRKQSGAGVVMINAVHDLDLLRYLCGEVRTVHAAFSSSQRGYDVPDTASISLTFQSGALGSYICTDAGLSPFTWDHTAADEPAFPHNPDGIAYVVAGTHGSLTLPGLQRHTGVLDESDWHVPLSSTYLAREQGDSYQRQMQHFLAVVRGEVQPTVHINDAAETMKLLDAVHRSSQSGATVSL